MNYNKISQKERHKKEHRTPREPSMELVQNPIMGTVISPSKLNVREKPDINSDVIDTLDPGDEVEVREVRGEWSYVYVDNTLQGYSMTKYIKVNRE